MNTLRKTTITVVLTVSMALTPFANVHAATIDDKKSELSKIQQQITRQPEKE